MLEAVIETRVLHLSLDTNGQVMVYLCGFTAEQPEERHFCTPGCKKDQELSDRYLKFFADCVTYASLDFTLSEDAFAVFSGV